MQRKINIELKTFLKCFAGIKSMRRMILLFGRNKGIHIHVIKRMVMLARCAKFKMQKMSEAAKLKKFPERVRDYLPFLPEFWRVWSQTSQKSMRRIISRGRSMPILIRG